MSEIVRAHVLVRGLVQGVAFRAFTEREALARGLRGGVRNLHDGRVEAYLQGPRTDVLALIDRLEVGPPRAQVEEVTVTWTPPNAAEPAFSIWY